MTSNLPPGRAWIYSRPDVYRIVARRLVIAIQCGRLSVTLDAVCADQERVGDQLERRGVDVALAAHEQPVEMS